MQQTSSQVKTDTCVQLKTLHAHVMQDMHVACRYDVMLQHTDLALQARQVAAVGSGVGVDCKVCELPIADRPEQGPGSLGSNALQPAAIICTKEGGKVADDVLHSLRRLVYWVMRRSSRLFCLSCCSVAKGQHSGSVDSQRCPPPCTWPCHLQSVRADPA